MMKKIAKIVSRVFLIILVISPYFLEPLQVDAKEAETLRELREQLADLHNQKSKTDGSKKQTQAQIQQKKNDVYNANKQIEQAEADIAEAEQLIVESEKKIESTTAETEELLKYTQMMQGNSAYIEYISGATTLTEMVMRMAAVEQITEYNQQKLEELEELINYNNHLKIDLEAKQTDLKQKIVSYQNSIASLGNDLLELIEFADDINDQIKNQKNLIQSYVDMGCKEDQSLTECVAISNNTGWKKPLNKAVVTSNWGYRISPLTGARKFHHGIDLGGNGQGTTVYAAASGTVSAITVKSSCGGNIVYIHSYVNGKPYTHYYAHLLSYNVKVGDKVTNGTAIGQVGGGSKTYWDKCSTGAHLHFGISNGFYLGGGPGSYSSYSTFVSKSVQPPGFPNKGSWFYKR